MKRWPTLAGLACLLAVTQASAQETKSVPETSAKPHRMKAKVDKPDSWRSASLGDIPFSDPYAPPVGSGKRNGSGKGNGSSKGKGAEFPVPERTLPAEPQGGFTIKAGRDSPDAPMTGGLMFRF
jgi:hypothetical protein